MIPSLACREYTIQKLLIHNWIDLNSYLCHQLCQFGWECTPLTGVWCIAEELTVAAEKAGLELEQMAGMSMELPSQKWSLSDDVGVNYIAYFQKPGIARP